VKIVTLSGAGSLTVNGNERDREPTGRGRDLAGDKLRFAPAAQASGPSYASFTFQVQDDGGTANAGVNLDPTPRTMTVNVTAVNDAPVAAADAYSTLEDTPSPSWLPASWPTTATRRAAP